MLSFYDYIVIVFYFVFIASLGFVFKKFNKGSKDYFAGGQRMCWWLLGSSLFISNFSCWTFTGAAGIAYKYGILVMYVYLMDVIGYIVGYVFFASRLRQMRLITAMDGVRRRFGKGNEQFFQLAEHYQRSPERRSLALRAGGHSFLGIYGAGYHRRGKIKYAELDNHPDRAHGANHVHARRQLGRTPPVILFKCCC